MGLATAMKYSLAILFVTFIMGAGALAQQPGPYTAQQAASGRTMYQSNCAICHVADLGGRNEAPQLAGGNFVGEWGDRTTSDLVSFIESTMPPNNPRGLVDEAFLSIAAFILEANGAHP